MPCSPLVGIPAIAPAPVPPAEPSRNSATDHGDYRMRQAEKRSTQAPHEPASMSEEVGMNDAKRLVSFKPPQRPRRGDGLGEGP